MTSPHQIILRPRPRWWRPLHPKFERCRQRILVVTDGLNYDAADPFGLTEFLHELSMMTPQPVVTTQQRGAFVFDAAVNIHNVDQIWLFGVFGTPLSPAEIQTIWDFMEAGGGLFATGDHETLGYALCGELPRVRKMRDWQNSPVSVERIDTVTDPGADRIAQFADQSDAIPQRIFPHYAGSGAAWYTHPLLRSPAGDIDVLPDHPHESVCLTGTDLADRYQLHGLDLDEFPEIGGTPLSPEIIASSVSAGRYLVDAGKPPTTPRLFGAISVWNGHLVGRGRIVTDATWHHFVNTNLDGTGSGRSGLAPGARAQIGEYYRNLADWITPVNRRWCIRWVHLLLDRYRYPLFEEWEPLPDPNTWPARVALGRRVEAAVDGLRGRGYAAEVVVEALEAADAGWLLDSLRPLPIEKRGEQPDPFLVNLDEVRSGVLGGVFDALVRGLPPNPEELETALADDGGASDVLKTVTVAAQEALAAARESFADRSKRTLERLG